jgi:hypothetical protein
VEHPSLWEKLELCDSRDGVANWPTAVVRIAARTVVTSGVSHRDGVRTQYLGWRSILACV